MRYLALDLGDKRTGLAVGTDTTTLASPLTAVTASDAPHRLQQIAPFVDDQGPDAFVLGLPLNMDDSEGPPAQRARRFARLLANRFGRPVHLVDERLTSDAANQQMAQTGLTHRQKKQRRDALAAAAILRNFFHTGAHDRIDPDP